MARVEDEATGASYSLRGVTENVRRKVDHPPALDALRVQMRRTMVSGLGVDQVVRRQAPVEVNVPQHVRSCKPF
jgi:hypothetical protein